MKIKVPHCSKGNTAQGCYCESFIIIKMGKLKAILLFSIITLLCDIVSNRKTDQLLSPPPPQLTEHHTLTNQLTFIGQAGSGCKN